MIYRDPCFDPRIPTPPPELVAALKSGTAVCVVGSGISQAAGLPSWEELLLLITAEAQEVFPMRTTEMVRSLASIRQGRFLEAAATLESLLGERFPRTVCRALRTSRQLEVDWKAVDRTEEGSSPSAPMFQSLGAPVERSAKPLPIHGLIMGLGFRAVITTNYDRLLEQSSPAGRPIPITATWSDPYLMQRVRDGGLLFKVHGDEGVPEDTVLTSRQYARLRANDQAQEALKILLRGSHVLWIGYGHRDPTFDLLISDAVQRYKLAAGFALLRADDTATISRMQELGSLPLEVPDNSLAGQFLNRLAAAVGRPQILEFAVKPSMFDEASVKVAATKLAKGLKQATGDASVWGTDEKTGRLWIQQSAAARSVLFDLLNGIDLNQSGSQHLRSLLKGIGIAEIEGAPIKYDKEEWLSDGWVTIRATDVGTVTEITPSGNLTIASGDLVLREAVLKAVERGAKRIILDLSQVRYMDSSGLGELVAARKRIIESGGQVALCSINKSVEDLLSLTQIKMVFSIYQTQEEARAAFR